MDNQYKITNLEDLIKYQNGEVVELPPFSEGQTFYARLKRPSLLSLARNGSIPNDLLQSANALFEKGSGVFSGADEKILGKMCDLMDVICEASFVEPTYASMKEAGIALTDEQKMFVFGYSQRGVNQLKSFH